MTQPGFEEICAGELREIGAGHVEGTVEGGVEFRSKLGGCYAANLLSRTSSRILMRIGKFSAFRFEDLRSKVAEIPWELLVGEHAPIALHVTSSGSALYHTGRIGEEIRAGIAERFARYEMTARFDGAPAESQLVFARFRNDRCLVSLDSSGELLYRREGKIFSTEAPMRETLASLILLAAGARDYDCILDPMCGSGTFSIEGAEILLGLAPGRRRDFAFTRWPCFSPGAFEHIRKKAAGVSSAGKGPLVFASDSDPGAVDAAGRNIGIAGLSGTVTLRRGDFFSGPAALPSGKRCLIALNPPYGARLDADSERIYRAIGAEIRKNYGGCGYAIVTPSLEHEKILSLPYDKKILFRNGGINVAVIIRYAAGVAR